MRETDIQGILREFRILLGRQSEAVEGMSDPTARSRAIRQYWQCQLRADALLAALAADGNTGGGVTLRDLAHPAGQIVSGAEPLSASPDLRDRLLSLSAPVTMPKGAVLFRTGEPTFGVFLITRGAVSLRLESDEGAVLVERLCGPGAVLGLPANLSHGRYSMTAVALQPSDFAFVRHEDVRNSLLLDSDTSLELLKTAGDEIIRLRTLLATVPISPLEREELATAAGEPPS